MVLFSFAWNDKTRYEQAMGNSIAFKGAPARDVRRMFGSIAQRYDLTNTVLSFGIHHLWRRTLILMLPETTEFRTLDLCTGTGDLIPLMQGRFGSCIGADFCFPMLLEGKKRNSAAELIHADALRMPFPDNSFDVVSVSFGVRNFENLSTGLSEIHRVLRPGGSALILEFGRPRNPALRLLYSWYSRYLMPLLGSMLTGNRDAYEYLPRTAKEFPAGKEFEVELKSVGLLPVKTRALTGGISYCYLAQKA